MIGSLHRRLKRIRRSRQIANVLIKHGFGHLVERIGIKLPIRKKVDGEAVRIPAPVRARVVLEELGPTFIKFGQVLSMRPDLIPLDFVEEFKKLQDRVLGFGYEDVELGIEGEFKAPIKELFDSFDKKPLAAASIAQVHKAVLDGKDVVVKVQRPEIEDKIEADIDILFNLAQLIAKHIPESRLYDPVGIVGEFAKTIRKELDFTIEARNAERFARNFADFPKVCVPKVYWELTSRRVLTMESIQGTKISDINEELNGEVRKNLSENIARSYMKQILIDGFYHADPHPGNIFVVNREVIAFTDFGITGRVDEYMKEKLSNLFIAIMQKNTNRIIEEFLDIGIVDDEVAIPEFRNDITELIEEYYGTTLKQADFPAIMNNVMRTALKHRIRIPANFAILIKTLVTMEGICRELNPDFNLTEVSKPFIESLVAERIQPARIVGRFIENVSELNKLIMILPKRLNQILSQLERGKLLIDIEHKGLNRIIAELDIASNRLSVSLIISAIIVGSSVIMLTGRGPLLFGFPVIGVIGYIIAGILGMGLVISILRSGRF